MRNMLPFYAQWVSKFLAFSNENESGNFSEKRTKFLGRLADSPGIADWQKNQAETALKLFFEQFDKNSAKIYLDPATPVIDNKADPAAVVKMMSKTLAAEKFAFFPRFSKC